MGMERIADYPGSVLWRASLFRATLGLHGFAHLHHSSKHTHARTQTHMHVDEQTWLVQIQPELKLKSFRSLTINTFFLKTISEYLTFSVISAGLTFLHSISMSLLLEA